MSDVERLKAELELAEACEELEAAREAMHADRSNEDLVASYQDHSNRVVQLRQAFRERYSVETGPGDAAPEVETVHASVQVDPTGGAS